MELVENKLKYDLNAFTDNKQQVWFIAKDIAELWGLINKEQTIRIDVDKDNQKTYPLYRSGKVRYVKIENEPGFYELLAKSKSDSAKWFQKWVSQIKFQMLTKSWKKGLTETSVSKKAKRMVGKEGGWGGGVKRANISVLWFWKGNSSVVIQKLCTYNISFLFTFIRGTSQQLPFPCSPRTKRGLGWHLVGSPQQPG